MSGKKSRNYLEARGFDAFCDLYHGLSERALSLSATLMGCAEVIRAIHRGDPEVVSNTRVSAELDDYVSRSKEVGSILRSFFWPQTNTEDIQDPALSLKFRVREWEPFDEIAWNSVFKGLASILEASLQPVRDIHETIKSYPVGHSPGSEQIPELLARLEKYLQDGSHLGNQPWVEFHVFNNWFLTRLRLVNHTITVNASIIQNSIEGEANSVAGFREDLDAMMLQAGDLESFVGLYKDPMVVERMLTDKDLLAGRPLPRTEALYDSIWAEMTGVLGVPVGKLRDRLQKLNSHTLDPFHESKKISGELTKIDKSLDELSHILLEMTDQAPLADPSADPA